MKIRAFYIAFFICIHTFCQTNKLEILKQNDDLENYIYETLDAFLKNPSEKNLVSLDQVQNQLWRDLKSKDENLAFVILLCNKGFYKTKFNMSTDAIESYEKAWSIYNANHLANYDIIEYCLKPLGNLYTVLGDYQNAENTIKSYLFLSEKNSSEKQKASAFINLSVVYQNSGRFDDAIHVLNQTLELKKLTPEQKAKALSNIITNLIFLKKFDAAKDRLNDLNSTVEKINDSQLKINTFKLSSIIAVNAMDYSKAENELKNIEELIKINFEFNNRDLARFYIEYATVLTKQNKLDEAINLLKKSIHYLLPSFPQKEISTEDLYAETTLIDAFDLIASIFSTKKQNENSLHFYKLSYKVEELLNNLYLYEETKLLQLNDNRIRSEKCLAIYYDLYQESKNERYIYEAFLLAEKTKAVVLKETIVKKQKQLQLKNEALVLDQIKFEKQNLQIKNELIKEQLKGNRANIANINELIELQNKTMLSLKETSEKLNKKYPSFLKLSRDLNMTALKEKLSNDNATMIEYFYGKNALYYFTITKDELNFLRIRDIDTVNKTVSKFNSYFDNASKINNDILGYNETAFKLYNLLQIQSKTKNLIIVPDGILNFVPFETLLTQKTESLSFKNLPYLLNDHQIIYNSSADFYLNSNINKPEIIKILGVFPVFEDSVQPLSYSIDEANVIRDLFLGNYLLKEEATKKEFIENVSDYNIIHLSTHANSGDFRTPASIQFYDETVYMHDIYMLNIHPQLVVLSACETGVGKLQKGEGVLSIARGFQHSGANNLVFSLWKVNDLSTSQLMTSFYKNYKKTSSTYLSNYKAKLEYLNNKNIDNIKKSPYYWGSFVFYGTIEPESSNTTFYILGLILTLIILFLLLKIKNAKP